MTKNDWAYIDIWSKKIRAFNLLGGKCKNCGNDNIFHLCFHHKNEDEKEFNISDNPGHRWSKIKKEVLKCQLLCNNCHDKLHFKDNVIDVSLRHNKQLYLEYKGEKCEKCEYNENPSSLAFHHKDKSEKLFNINKFRIRFISDLDNYITEELDKCIILCHNCHNEEHVDFERFNKFKKEIYYKVDNFKEIQSKIPREEVKKMYENGMRQVDIAKHFNASKATISMIIKKQYEKN